MTKADPVATARELVVERFPQARQAWLAGSVVLGLATETSDLDIPVLLDAVEVHRETLRYRGWPVELFVHTEASIHQFLALDLARRRPSLARMISTGVPLVSGTAGDGVRRECAAVLAAGPGFLDAVGLAYARYTLTDQLDDLAGGAAPPVRDAIAFDVWRGSAELLLACAGRWTGTGKWLVREVQALDEDDGSDYANRLHDGLHEALDGRPDALTVVADEILQQAGGRLGDGFYLNAPPLQRAES
ncbi:nucleotidyltransferase domain-containing protein [Microlunatus ginsengisoli]|uniref:Nucleotidyltransferase domain-containing protein n=2 Tax=Microlunatus ginsengisoli TaxID=363863 RepID=A0ABP7AYB3_9ACTN